MTKTDDGNITLNETNIVENEKCGSCSRKVDEHDKVVLCDGCNKWHHYLCAGISNYIYNRIQKAPSDKPYFWCCSTCKLCPTGTNEVTKINTSLDRPIQKTEINKPESPQLESETVQRQLDRALTENLELRKVIEILTVDHEQTLHELERSQTEIGKLQDEARAKTLRINELSQIVINQYSRHSGLVDLIPEKNLSSGSNITSQGHTASDEVGRTDDPDSPEHKKLNSRPAQTFQNIIVGDSIIKNIEPWLSKSGPTSADTKIDSMPGAKIADVSKKVSEIARQAPENIVIHVGSNNINMARDPNQVMRPLWYTVDALHKKSPRSNIVINEILYREDIPNRKVDDVNEALIFMCRELKVKFLKLNNVILPQHFNWDGVHLNNIGTQILADRIIEGLKAEEMAGDPSTVVDVRPTCNNKKGEDMGEVPQKHEESKN